MNIQTLSTEFGSNLQKEWTKKSIEESHKSKISYFKEDKVRKNNEDETVYGLKETALTGNAFTHLFLKL